MKYAKRNDQGIAYLISPVQCARCDDFDHAPCNERGESIAEIIASLEDKTEHATNDGWIPCSERLPDFSDLPILCDGDSVKPCIITAHLKSLNRNLSFPANRVRRVYKDGTRREYWTGSNGRKEIKPESGVTVIAWQPLPEPYKG